MMTWRLRHKTVNLLARLLAQNDWRNIICNNINYLVDVFDSLLRTKNPSNRRSPQTHSVGPGFGSFARPSSIAAQPDLMSDALADRP